MYVRFQFLCICKLAQTSVLLVRIVFIFSMSRVCTMCGSYARMDNVCGHCSRGSMHGQQLDHSLLANGPGQIIGPPCFAVSHPVPSPDSSHLEPNAYASHVPLWHAGYPCYEVSKCETPIVQDTLLGGHCDRWAVQVLSDGRTAGCIECSQGTCPALLRRIKARGLGIDNACMKSPVRVLVLVLVKQ